MASSSACIRCSRPVEVESASGLCLECFRTINSPGSTSQDRLVPAQVNLVASTVAEQLLPKTGGADQTLTHDPGAATVTDSPNRTKVPLPAAPPGYELIHELGIGGMGAVYLAEDIALQKQVAIKFLRGLPFGDALERFLVEVRALAALDHPNIVRVISTDFSRSVPFFTMDYESGATLADLVKSRGPLPPDEAVKFIRAVAGAITAAHAKDILHRDLKPSNILLSASGVPKVSDFGLAKRTDRDDGITQASGAIGTPSFMPPEQISKRNGEVGPASDVYGLGGTLYFLLTGQAPFRGDGKTDTMNQVLHDWPKRPRALRPEIPMALEAIVMKCLEKDPVDRYPTADALIADLDKYSAGGEGIEAPQLTRRRRLGRWARRNRGRIAAGAAMVTAMAAVAVIAIELARPAKPVDLADEIRRKLRAGEAVTLIGETGLPQYYRWQLGGGEFGTCPTGEKTCYYESVGYSLLEIVPDPGINRYRLLLDIRHVGAAGGPPVGPDRSWVGPYLSQAESPTADGRPVHSLFGLTYSDIHPNAAPKAGPAGQQQNVVRFRAAAISLRPNRDPGLHQRVIPPPLPFTQSATLSGEWRTFRIDVTPDGVRAEWKNDNGQFVPVITLDAVPTSKAYAGLQTLMNKDEPGSAVTVPAWSPRMPLGVWSFRAGVSLRNVMISPL